MAEKRGWSLIVREKVVAGLSCLENSMTKAPRLPTAGKVMEPLLSVSAPSLTWMVVYAVMAPSLRHARNLILNLLELVAEDYEVEVNVVCTSPTIEEDVAIFSVEISPGHGARMKAEFRRVVQELQTLMLRH